MSFHSFFNVICDTRIIRAIIENYVVEQKLREGFEYRPGSCSQERPLLIREYFRLFLGDGQVAWDGLLDPKEDYDGDKTLVEKIRTIVPGFASKQPVRPSQ